MTEKAPKESEAPKCVCTMVPPPSSGAPSPFRGNSVVNIFVVAAASPTFYIIFSVVSFLLGYVVYGSLDAGLRFVLFAYILVLAMAIQSMPGLGLVLTIPYLIFFEYMYGAFLLWCGLTMTTLSLVYMIISVVLGSLVAIATFSVGISVLTHGSMFATRNILRMMQKPN